MRVELARHRQVQPSEVDAELRDQEAEEGRLKVALASSEAEHASVAQALGQLLGDLSLALGYHTCARGGARTQLPLFAVCACPCPRPAITRALHPI